MAIKQDYPEELTAAMHAEFSVSKEQEIYLRAGCVWKAAHRDNLTHLGEITKECERYGISFYDAVKYKDHWLNLISQKGN